MRTMGRLQGGEVWEGIYRPRGLELEDGFGRHWPKSVNWCVAGTAVVFSLDQVKPVQLLLTSSYL